VVNTAASNAAASSRRAVPRHDREPFGDVISTIPLIIATISSRSSNLKDVNQVGRPLAPEEIDSYDVIPKYLARRVRVFSVPSLPGRYDGMTIGFNIFLKAKIRPDGSSPLLAHELVHVRQWAELGWFGFSHRYLRSFAAGLVKQRSWMDAYRSIEAEREARIEATDWLRRRTLRMSRSVTG